MKLIIFTLLILILVAASALAQGLEITEIEVHVDYDEAYTYRIENRERIDSTSVPVANNSKIDVDILPGSNVTFTVRVENTFQGEKPVIKGTFVAITIEDIDDGADLDGESLDFDLEPGDDYRYDVKFYIPLDVDAGTYNTIIEAEGDDKNGTLYRTELSNLKFEVKKQSHDIRITKVLLSPSVVDCDRKAKLTAEIANVGSNPENEITLEFKAISLGINSFDKDISLQSSEEASDEEKMHTKSLNIEIPSFLRPGTYQILINLYWKNFVLFDQKTAELVVKDCITGATAAKTEQKEEKEEAGPVTVIQPEEKIKEQIPREELITATQEISVLEYPILISVFLGGIIIVILFVLVVVGYAKKAKVL